MNTKTRIELHMTFTDVSVVMSEGNPGALTACVELIRRGREIDPQSFMGGMSSILECDSLGIYGSRLYMLWNDVCSRQAVKMIAVLRAHQLGQLAGCTEQAINHAIDNRGQGLDTDEIVKAVMARLDKFNLPLANANEMPSHSSVIQAMAAEEVA